MRVRLCFFVKVRNATGLRVVGGRSTGRIETFGGGAAGLKVFRGCTGVPKPGEEEGIGFAEGWDGVSVSEGMAVVERLNEFNGKDKSETQRMRSENAEMLLPRHAIVGV